MENKYIGIFGMMGSGKSVILNEYLIQSKINNDIDKFVNFTPPPVEAKFRGMDFEFVDQIFALQKNGIICNFYELDAPTINKWTQFIGIADAIIIAYNYKKEDYFESPEKFIRNIIDYSDPSVPLFFIINNCSDLEEGKHKLESQFNISGLPHKTLDIRVIPPAEVEYTQEYGRRVYVSYQRLDALYQDVLSQF